jgi:lysophospholipase L1-like esterase
MKKLIISLFAFVFLLSGCSIDKPAEHVTREITTEDKAEPVTTFIPKTLKVVSVGDSLTQGVGDSTKSGGYVPYLEEHLETLKGIKDAEFENYGVRGNRTEQLLKRLKSKEVKKSIQQSDIVMITIGGNDVMKVFRENLSNLNVAIFQDEMLDYEGKMKEIIETIRDYNNEAGIVLVGLYNPFNTWFSDIQEVNEIIKSWNNASSRILAAYERSVFVPVDDIFADSGNSLLYEDYFHPNDKGYEKMANRMFEVLTNGETLATLTKGEFLIEEEGQ